MFDFEFLARGFILGFLIAAPVGPIGVLCIRRSLVHGALNGFVSGLGAATADAIYGAITGLGLAALSSFLVGQQLTLRLAGGLLLLWMALQIWRSRPVDAGQEAPAAAGGLLGAYLSTLVLTLSNPATILAFVGIFAGAGLAGSASESSSSLALVGGVFLGSAAWWLTLSQLAAALRRWLTGGRLVELDAREPAARRLLRVAAVADHERRAGPRGPGLHPPRPRLGRVQPAHQRQPAPDHGGAEEALRPRRVRPPRRVGASIP